MNKQLLHFTLYANEYELIIDLLRDYVNKCCDVEDINYINHVNINVAKELEDKLIYLRYMTLDDEYGARLHL